VDDMQASAPQDVGKPEFARVAAPAPASASDPLFVTVASFDGGRHAHGPCMWEPPAGALPQVGELCVIVRAIEEDGEGEQAVVIAFDRDTTGGLFMPGDLKATARSSAPAGWLICDGTLLVRADHQALFDAIGTAYNTGGETGLQFRVPNLKGRVPVGQDASQTEFDALGESGGAKTHALSVAEMPSHNHGGVTGNSSVGDFIRNVGGGVAQMFSSSDAAVLTAQHTHPITAQGGGGAHNNLQPYQVVNYMIYEGG
jgi:microcystin-dependent protein